MEIKTIKPFPASIIVTTYKTDTLYTQACLESIRQWKREYHELIVVVHDESVLLRAYLESCKEDGLIDKLIYTISEHGHTRSYNIGVQNSTHDIIFNICNDICIGPNIIDECSYTLMTNKRIGMIGWIWYTNQITYTNGIIGNYKLKNNNNPYMDKTKENSIRKSSWFTGKTFQALNGAKEIHLPNTSFFGCRKEVLNKIGGGFGKEFHHYWADDFLSYAVLDQELDIISFEDKFKKIPYFSEFQYSHCDVQDRRRHLDALKHNELFFNYINDLGGGMSADEHYMLYHLGKSIPDNSVVINFGTWRGASCINLMQAAKDKKIDFYFYDCFDLPQISNMSGQPPVSIDEFKRYIVSYVGKEHTINIIKINTLDLKTIPQFDFMFVDAGHIKKCIDNDILLAKSGLKNNSKIVFHDYNQPMWPDVKTSIDSYFKNISVYKTLAIVDNHTPVRQEYKWI